MKVKGSRNISKIAVWALIVLVTVLCAVIILKKNKEKPVYVKIYHHNVLVKTYDLSKLKKEEKYIISDKDGTNVITVSKDCVKMTEADCPDKICVKTGNALENKLPIICAPHGVSVIVEYEEEKDEISY